MRLNNIPLSVQGTQGDFGSQGLSGPIGSNGSIGTIGIQGLTGNVGRIGGSGSFGIAGLPGVHFLMPTFSGKSHLISTFNTTLISASPTGNIIRLTPFVPAKTLSIKSMSINITTGNAGTNHRILVYSDLNGYPNAKLIETTNLDCSTIGIKTVNLDYTFNAGTIYWIGGYSNSTLTCQLIPSANLLLATVSTGGITYTTFQYNGAFSIGSAPSSLNGVTPASFSNGSALATYLTT